MVKLAIVASCLLLLFLFVASHEAAAAAVAEHDPVPEGDEEEKTCACSGPECRCCVDFNLTFVDLGGPGCVKMRYVSKEEGMTVNVSYGDKQLHAGQIKSSGVSMSCMNIVHDLAQICAKFSDVVMTDHGMNSCASLVPSILGSHHEGFQLGCFVVDAEGMRFINSSFTESPDLESEASSEDQEEQDHSTAKPETPAAISQVDALNAAVNEAAEEGIAWFSNLLGFNFGKSDNETLTTTVPPSVSN